MDPADPGFERVKGLRVYSREATIELPWPELGRARTTAWCGRAHDFDELLIHRAEKAGARLHGAHRGRGADHDDGWVRGRDDPSGRGQGRRADRDPRPLRDRGRRRGAPLREARRRPRDDTRPLGIAARRYYRTDYHPGPWFESWLDLWEGDLLLPGYGWLFPVAGGTINLGAGLLNTFKDFKDISAQRLFNAFATMLPSSRRVARTPRRDACFPDRCR